MKILMVCLGNICRSPLAHGILEHLVRQKGLNWEIDSAGTGGWHVGQQPDSRSIAIAKKYGLDISGQSCRKFDTSDFERFDQILVMDYNNLNDVKALARNEEEHNKISLFLKDSIVPDPYHDDDQFDPIYQIIEKRCKELIEEFASTI
ncbi:low molecular weight protein-tyrosine-phosphatase [Daejeonella sp.]|uniref:low molecular weight protein-tyrosine-phosphatase n=1 Tax=Daejeonella sp. TaxID=2805397 RepID=UPI0027307553|nr:low molecular weight protein-tyrosine-phosphatase [Daejeonella sp.]MDP2413944.1 low molecular weight protein-tyrosine-phosphatase [Daejeonella sp.]